MNEQIARGHYYARMRELGEGDSAPAWEQLTREQRNEWRLTFRERGPAMTGHDEAEAPDDDVDMVNHPPHYNSGPKCPGCDRTIQCIDVVRWLPFNPGNAIKYLWRRYFGGGKAGEDSIQPVEKARWYLDDEVARLKLEEP